MSATHDNAIRDEDELVPTQTAGYKPGSKKTLEEYAQLDAADESLKKWKESLGVGTAKTSSEKLKVNLVSLALEVKNHPDVVLDLSRINGGTKIKDKPIVIKEGVEYQLKIKFNIENQVVSGLKYLQVVKRKGIQVDKTEEMVGSYGPNDPTQPYEKKFSPEEAPSGLLARGHYEVKSKFVDDDGVTHLKWEWSFDIKKDWE